MTFDIMLIVIKMFYQDPYADSEVVIAISLFPERGGLIPVKGKKRPFPIITFVCYEVHLASFLRNL